MTQIAINLWHPLIFIYLFNKSSFGSYCVCGPVLGAGDAAVHTAERALPALLELTVRAGRGPETNKHARKHGMFSASKKNPGNTGGGEGRGLCYI